MTQILGEKNYEDIQAKLSKKNTGVKSNKSRENKKHSLSIANTVLNDRVLMDSPIKHNISTYENEERPHNKMSKIESTPRDESSKYSPHSGKIAENYQKLGGLGPNKNKHWNDVYKRRKDMLEFSNRVNYKNKEKLNSQSPTGSNETTTFNSAFAKSNLSNKSKLDVLKERRDKALEFAKSIKKPRPIHSQQPGYSDERFVGYDNNQYMLENQKIKMLFN